MLEHPDLPVPPVSVEQGVPLAVLGHPASLEILALLVRAVLPALLVPPARTEQTAHRGHLDLPDQWERLENRALLEILAIPESREILDLLDRLDSPEQWELPVS